MSYVVEYTNEFEVWWEALGENDHISIDAHVQKLEERGPRLPFPYSSGIHGSRHPHMRERSGKPLRIFMPSIRAEWRYC